MAICTLNVAFAQTESEPKPGKEQESKSMLSTLARSETDGTVVAGGTKISYKSVANRIVLENDMGDKECAMFYVSYCQTGANRDSRPVTFAFNGGPGSSTIWLHMGALGPMRAPMKDDGSLPAPPYQAVPNAESWLDFTDVVCVDAPGTGYSRIARPELASKFFGVDQDVEAFRRFVIKWLKDNNRWTSPVFIAGESYGGIRGSALSARLFDSGVAASGFISISGTSNFMTLDGMRGNDSTYVGFLPSMAACAWYHKKLNPKFKSVDQVFEESKTWSDNVYGPALLKGDSLSLKEKVAIAEKMSEFLGLSPTYCLGSNLKVSEFAFFRELMRDRRLTIGRYDGRLLVKEEQTVGTDIISDPSDDAVTPPFTSAINDLFINQLMINTPMDYLTSGNVYPWKEREGAYSERASDLRNLISKNPHFKVLYCCGYYDLACPVNATMYTVNHMGLDPDQRKQIGFEFYPAGHMMYIEKSSRIKFHDDARSFVKSCTNNK